MYRSYVSIPEERAVRVTYERERLLDVKRDLCLDSSTGSQTVKEGIDDNLVDLNTTVKYKNGETKTLLDTCTQVEKTIEGTMITMYKTNPNGSSQLNENNNLLSILIALFVLTKCFVSNS